MIFPWLSILGSVRRSKQRKQGRAAKKRHQRPSGGPARSIELLEERLAPAVYEIMNWGTMISDANTHNPATSGAPDSYLITEAGADGIFGTTDDVNTTVPGSTTFRLGRDLIRPRDLSSQLTTIPEARGTEEEQLALALIQEEAFGNRADNFGLPNPDASTFSGVISTEFWRVINDQTSEAEGLAGVPVGSSTALMTTLVSSVGTMEVDDSGTPVERFVVRAQPGNSTNAIAAIASPRVRLNTDGRTEGTVNTFTSLASGDLLNGEVAADAQVGFSSGTDLDRMQPYGDSMGVVARYDEGTATPPVMDPDDPTQVLVPGVASFADPSDDTYYYAYVVESHLVTAANTSSTFSDLPLLRTSATAATYTTPSVVDSDEGLLIYTDQPHGISNDTEIQILGISGNPDEDETGPTFDSNTFTVTAINSTTLRADGIHVTSPGYDPLGRGFGGRYRIIETNNVQLRLEKVLGEGRITSVANSTTADPGIMITTDIPHGLQTNDQVNIFGVPASITSLADTDPTDGWTTVPGSNTVNLLYNPDSNKDGTTGDPNLRVVRVDDTHFVLQIFKNNLEILSPGSIDRTNPTSDEVILLQVNSATDPANDTYDPDDPRLESNPILPGGFDFNQSYDVGDFGGGVFRHIELLTIDQSLSASALSASQAGTFRARVSLSLDDVVVPPGSTTEPDLWLNVRLEQPTLGFQRSLTYLDTDPLGALTNQDRGPGSVGIQGTGYESTVRANQQGSRTWFDNFTRSPAGLSESNWTELNSAMNELRLDSLTERELLNGAQPQPGAPHAQVFRFDDQQDGVYEVDDAGNPTATLRDLARAYVRRSRVDTTGQEIDPACQAASQKVVYTDGQVSARVNLENPGDQVGLFARSIDTDGDDVEDAYYLGQLERQGTDQLDLSISEVKFGLVGTVSNTTPITLTTATPHRLTEGETVTVTVRRVRGNTAANGTFEATVTGANTMELAGTAGNGDYISDTGEWEVVHTLRLLEDVGTENGGVLRMTSSSSDGEIEAATPAAGTVRITSTNHGLMTGTMINIEGDTSSTTLIARRESKDVFTLLKLNWMPISEVELAALGFTLDSLGGKPWRAHSLTLSFYPEADPDYPADLDLDDPGVAPVTISAENVADTGFLEDLMTATGRPGMRGYSLFHSDEPAVDQDADGADDNTRFAPTWLEDFTTRFLDENNAPASKARSSNEAVVIAASGVFLDLYGFDIDGQDNLADNVLVAGANSLDTEDFDIVDGSQDRTSVGIAVLNNVWFGHDITPETPDFTDDPEFYARNDFITITSTRNVDDYRETDGDELRKLLPSGQIQEVQIASVDDPTIVVTTVGAHGLENGDSVRIQGVQGIEGANGTFVIQLIELADGTIDPLRFRLTGTQGSGTYIPDTADPATWESALLQPDQEGFLHSEICNVSVAVSVLSSRFDGRYRGAQLDNATTGRPITNLEISNLNIHSAAPHKMSSGVNTDYLDPDRDGVNENEVTVSALGYGAIEFRDHYASGDPRTPGYATIHSHGGIDSLYGGGVRATGDIASASSTAPITIQVANHGLQTGNEVVIADVIPTDQSGAGRPDPINGTWTITVTGTDSFRLDGSDGRDFLFDVTDATYTVYNRVTIRDNLMHGIQGPAIAAASVDDRIVVLETDELIQRRSFPQDLNFTVVRGLDVSNNTIFHTGYTGFGFDEEGNYDPSQDGVPLQYNLGTRDIVRRTTLVDPDDRIISITDTLEGRPLEPWIIRNGGFLKGVKGSDAGETVNAFILNSDDFNVTNEFRRQGQFQDAGATDDPTITRPQDGVLDVKVVRDPLTGAVTTLWQEQTSNLPTGSPDNISGAITLTAASDVTIEGNWIYANGARIAGQEQISDGHLFPQADRIATAGDPPEASYLNGLPVYNSNSNERQPVNGTVAISVYASDNTVIRRNSIHDNAFGGIFAYDFSNGDNHSAEGLDVLDNMIIENGSENDVFADHPIDDVAGDLDLWDPDSANYEEDARDFGFLGSNLWEPTISGNNWGRTVVDTDAGLQSGYVVDGTITLLPGNVITSGGIPVAVTVTHANVDRNSTPEPAFDGAGSFVPGSADSGTLWTNVVVYWPRVWVGGSWVPAVGAVPYVIPITIETAYEGGADNPATPPQEKTPDAAASLFNRVPPIPEGYSSQRGRGNGIVVQDWLGDQAARFGQNNDFVDADLVQLAEPSPGGRPDNYESEWAFSIADVDAVVDERNTMIVITFGGNPLHLGSTVNPNVALM